MPKNTWWVLSFFVLYAIHAVFYLASRGNITMPVSAGVVKGISIMTLVCLTVLVVTFIATRDEVLRHLALRAGAVSAVATGLLSYTLSAFDIAVDMVTANLWAIAMLIFLVVYGCLAWLPRS